jgi:hypothetical protein
MLNAHDRALGGITNYLVITALGTALHLLPMLRTP